MTSHNRYPSTVDLVKEPHAVSLKVLRLSRPSLVAQLPLPPPSTPATSTQRHSTDPIPASLAYSTSADDTSNTNPTPFLLSPILQLPPSFGSAYVGETFSCTLCANHEALDPPPPPTSDYATSSPSASSSSTTTQQPGDATPASAPIKRTIRDVRIEAEMKTPLSSSTNTNTSGAGGGGGGGSGATKLVLRPPLPFDNDDGDAQQAGVDLDPGQTLQRIVDFDLKEEGNHVLGVTVSYYEATETSGRTRTFRKLYQFVCKPSLIVRTKAGLLGTLVEEDGERATEQEQEQQEQTPPPPVEGSEEKNAAVTTITTTTEGKSRRRRWVLEAQLENCSEDTMELERVELTLEDGLTYKDCNWEATGSPKPVLHSQEVEQVCFVVEEKEGETAKEEHDGRIVFGVLGIGWRGEMGSRGFLATGKLGART